MKLGCVMPGETPAVFGDALRRLASAATYLYQDGPRAWYATQPTVTKLAEDRAEHVLSARGGPVPREVQVGAGVAVAREEREHLVVARPRGLDAGVARRGLVAQRGEAR